MSYRLPIHVCDSVCVTVSMYVCSLCVFVCVIRYTKLLMLIRLELAECLSNRISPQCGHNKINVHTHAHTQTGVRVLCVCPKNEKRSTIMEITNWRTGAQCVIRQTWPKSKQQTKQTNKQTTKRVNVNSAL